MARPKEFNRQEALDTAMDLFWTRGYEATTMTDLRLAMGIGRQSLYDTFGDKEQLFAEVLDQYIGLNDVDVARYLNRERGLEGIRSFFSARVEMLSAGVRRGCLMMNSCVELSLHDKDVAAQIKAGLGTLQQGFETALHAAIEKEQLDPSTEIDAAAAFLTSQVAGMVVMAKNQASKQKLRAVANVALRSLS